MNISIIIPAHNAAGTLGETLESILKQTFQNWEAIVVDNGSNDGTQAVASAFAEKDHRIRMVSEPQKGVSMARNTGIKAARFDWLLFLDADDWIVSRHLERMTNVLAENPNLDGVHCGWINIAPDGSQFCDGFCKEEGDLFNSFVSTCLFAIHACIIRRSVVMSVGGFDTSLVTCEDWDLWQRIARTGVSFGAVREALSFYRMRQGSASRNGFKLFVDGLLVIERGHSSDPRVPNPRPENANGLPVTQLPTARFNFMCWCAGLFIGTGMDARPLLNTIDNIQDASIDPETIANNIFNSALIHACQTKNASSWFWPSIEPSVKEFLFALEKQSQIIGLAHRTMSKIYALQHAPFNNTSPSYAIHVEITKPIHDIMTPENIERVNCNIELEGTFLGNIVLPVYDKVLPRYLLTDAIAERFAWQILGRHLEHSVYPGLNIVREKNGFSIWRKNRRLTKTITNENAQSIKQKMHDEIGWIVFLQEICGCHNWTFQSFYAPDWKVFLKATGWKVFLQEFMKCKIMAIMGFLTKAKNRKYIVDDGGFTFDISDEFTDIKVLSEKFDVLITVGGVPIGVVTIPVHRNVVRALELRYAIVKASGYELCRAAVREGLLGKSLTDKPLSLRDRLKAAKESLLQGNKDTTFSKTHTEFKFTPEIDRILNYMLCPKDACIILGRRLHKELGTSASRRAMLPPSLSSELINAARVTGEPVLISLSQDEQPKHLMYMPEVVCHPLQEKQSSTTAVSNNTTTQEGKLVSGSQDYFNNYFAEKEDPWNYTSAYEQKKYEQTLAMLPRLRIRNALEIACAEGHFTMQLAPHVDSLIAADISQIAVDRAAKRCRNIKNIRFQQLDMVCDPLPGTYELIVCSEVLYYVGEYDTLKIVAHKLVDALQPKGYLLMAHANTLVDDPDHTGFDWEVPFGIETINKTFIGIRSIRLVKEIRTPLYRIQLFQKRARMSRPFCYNAPEIINLKYQPTPIEPNVAAYVRWRSGGHPQSSIDKNAVTRRLPILMYHRVAPTGAASTARYRITPEQFEEQLRYLRNEGYYSIHLEDWFYAMKRKMPLPGKAVILTFDDGYLDFKTYAWQLLKQYGFLATVFLVTDNIGNSNSWDSAYGEELPLLGWEDIRQLQSEGVEFGSHTASHPYLTSLSPAEIVREGVLSRAALSGELGKTVKTFAYPYGDVDEFVQRLIGACGYTFGLSCNHDLCGFHDPLLALPRIEVLNSDDLQNFVVKLGTSPAHIHS